MQVCAIARARAATGGSIRPRRTSSSAASFQITITDGWAANALAAQPNPPIAITKTAYRRLDIAFSLGLLQLAKALKLAQSGIYRSPPYRPQTSLVRDAEPAAPAQHSAASVNPHRLRGNV